jgi:hypothetical protein
MTASSRSPNIPRPSRLALTVAAGAAVALMAIAPLSVAANVAITVHSNVGTVYEGGGAQITLTGPANQLCGYFINESFIVGGTIATWRGTLSWATVASGSGNSGTQDNTVDFRCYSETTPTDGPTDEAVDTPFLPPPPEPPLDTPEAPLVAWPNFEGEGRTYEETYVSGATIIFKASGVTPPPTATTTAPTDESQSTRWLLLAGIAVVALMTTVSIRRFATKRR